MNLKYFTFIFIFLINGLVITVQTQDLFNLDNSIKYADYLYKSHEFKLAANEYERIMFLDSADNDAAFRLVQSYRKSNNYNLAIDRLTKYNQNFDILPYEWSKEYARLLILNKNYFVLNNFINNNSGLKEQDKVFFKVISAVYNHNWEKARINLQNNNTVSNKYLNELKLVLSEQEKLKYKSVPLAVALSTVIPGTGKIYSGYWKDGLFSLLIVGVSGLQAYRGFQKNGIKSKYGWVYLTMGTGFYIGNIYGTGKAVNKKNSELNHKIIHKIENIFNRY